MLLSEDALGNQLTCFRCSLDLATGPFVHHHFHLHVSEAQFESMSAPQTRGILVSKHRLCGVDPGCFLTLAVEPQASSLTFLGFNFVTKTGDDGKKHLWQVGLNKVHVPCT